MALLIPAGPSVTAEMALSGATGSYGAWDSAKWDQALWGPDVAWQDVSRYLEYVTTERKFSRDLNVWTPGTASIRLANDDRRFSADNISGPYVVGGVSGIRPWRPARLRAAWAGVDYYLYTGYGLAFEETWLPGHTRSYVTVPCTDEMSRLAGFDGLAQTPVGAGETSGQRIHRVLNNAGHTGLRNVAVGQITMQATDLSQNAVTELKLVADSEGGALWIEPDGMVTFEDRTALVDQARSNTIQATFGDGSGSELAVNGMALAFDGDLLINVASYARVGGTAQTAANATSRALYGDQRSTRTDLVCETDAQALALAQFAVDRYSAPELRITQITVKPRTDPARLWPQVLGRRVRDLVRVVARPIGGTTVVQDCHIAGIHHETDGTNWTTTFDLWSATFFQNFGRWDTAEWDVSTWFY